MKKVHYILSIFIFGLFLLLPQYNADARSGCCSHHDGVCGCGCCDGTPLSATCAPYYPECNGTEEEAETYTAPTPITYEFNGRTYYSYADYSNAKTEYENQQTEIKRLEEEKENLQRELDEASVQTDDQGEVKGAATLANQITPTNSASTNSSNNSGSFTDWAVGLGILIGGGAWIAKKIKN
ncbi:MAG: hypothetical protein WCW66_00310 [Patescibacteria group bacterium]